MENSFRKYLAIAVARPFKSPFYYGLPQEFEDEALVGAWATIPFGRSKTHGYVIEPPQDVENLKDPELLKQLKPLLSMSSQEFSVSPEILKLAQFVSEYYHSPLGEVLNAAASPASMGYSAKKAAIRKGPIPEQKPIQLSSAQKTAFDLIQASQKSVTLLQGVTGSGKTEIYIELAKLTLQKNRSVLILVPEIALTHQLHRRFEEGLGAEVGQWHSALPTAQRKRLWTHLIRGEIRCVLGARSAVFAPLKDLGLIVIDEEHDPTYKQEDRVRYHARDVAIYRSKLANAKVILGSATPSLETIYNVDQKKYDLVELCERYSNRAMPKIEIVDLTESELIENTQGVWSLPLLEEIRETIRKGDQVILFLNRRGYASFLLCTECGHTLQCPNCSISLTFYKKSPRLSCHLCGHKENIPNLCSNCMTDSLRAMGSGTEGLETDLKTLLPEARIARLDRDQITSASRLEKVIENFKRKESDILIGTQMLTKGHDFPNVTLVAVALADGLFRWPDFRANERALQTLIQVSGRSGRGEKPGKVLIQTYQCDHSIFQVMTGQMPLKEFIEREMEVRDLCHYPPKGKLARIRIEDKEIGSGSRAVQRIAQDVMATVSNVEVLGPSEAVIFRVKNRYRWDITLRAQSVSTIQKALVQVEKLAQSQKIHVMIDVDPMSFG
jgi:primosomal protein N' (replication factor Y)